MSITITIVLPALKELVVQEARMILDQIGDNLQRHVDFPGKTILSDSRGNQIGVIYVEQL